MNQIKLPGEFPSRMNKTSNFFCRSFVYWIDLRTYLNHTHRQRVYFSELITLEDK